MTSVYLIVYDMSKWNSIAHYLSLGRYFSAVEVFGKIYYFRPPGAVVHGTKVENVAGLLRERKRVYIGESNQSPTNVLRTVKDLSLSFNKNYDVVANNSNHFCNAFCFAHPKIIAVVKAFNTRYTMYPFLIKDVTLPPTDMSDRFRYVTIQSEASRICMPIRRSKTGKVCGSCKNNKKNSIGFTIRVTRATLSQIAGMGFEDNKLVFIHCNTK